MPYRMLFLLRSRYPQFRTDLTELFANHMAGRGHGIDWLMQSEEPLAESREVQWGGGTVFVAPRRPPSGLWNRVWNNLRDLAQDLSVFRRLGRGKYDLVVVRDKFLSALPALVAARLHGARCVFWLSYPFPEEWQYRCREGLSRYPLLDYLRGHLGGWLFYRVILPRVDHLFVLSEQMRRDVAAQGMPSERITPVPMGVSLEGFDAGMPPKRTGQGPTVLYLGSMSQVRSLDFVIRAFACTLKDHPDATLVMVGDGDSPDDLSLLRREAESLGIAPSVVFTGFVPMEEALAHVAGADVCLSPFKPVFQLLSTSPTKLVEYLAMGKPTVVNSEHPEQVLAVEESGAGVHAPFVEEPFGKAISTLLDLSDEERQAMGRKGRAWVESHRTYAIIADEVEAKLAEVLEPE